MHFFCVILIGAFAEITYYIFSFLFTVGKFLNRAISTLSSIDLMSASSSLDNSGLMPFNLFKELKEHDSESSDVSWKWFGD